MRIIRITYNSLKSFISLGLMNAAASLAYYALFSLIPVLLIILFAASSIYDASEISAFLINQVSGLLGSETAVDLAEAISHLTVQKGSIAYTIFSVLLLLYTATSVFSTLRTAFNKIFNLPPPATGLKSLLDYAKGKLLSLVFIAAIAAILLVSFLANIYMNTVDFVLLERITGWTVFSVRLTDLFIHLILLSACFLFVFWLFIEVKLSMKHLVTGSFVTALLFVTGKSLLGYYISQNEAVTIYSSAGTVIMILLWTYYSSAVVLFGCTTIYHLTADQGISQEKS